jgi:hypothetical protein
MFGKISHHIILAIPLLQVAAAYTHYQCYGAQSPKFNADCQVAAATLVLRQTGWDSYAWFPNYGISYGYGSCTAVITASNNRLWAMNVMASFNQLGARCQSGGFQYDNGFLYASLLGTNQRKRDLHRNATDDNHLLDTDDFQWTTDEDVYNITSFSNTTLEADETNLRKRANPGQIFRRVPGKTGSPGVNVLVHATGSVANIVAQHHEAAARLISADRDLFAAAARNNAAWIMNTGTAVNTGSSVNALATAMRLDDGWRTWAEMLNFFGDGVSVLVTAAVEDFFNSDYTSAIYHIVEDSWEPVISFIIAGVAGVIGALPNGK